MIFLNDWGSAATCGRECDYHGTQCLGRKWNDMFPPKSWIIFVLLSFSMMKQIFP
jgi:hypothetical protein